MAGNRLGRLKVVARGLGMSVTAYEARRKAGEKWCTSCKAWHRVERFVADRSRYDALRARCLLADHGRPRAKRRPSRERARNAVAYAIRGGCLADPNRVPCTDCGHLGPERRHEYDHVDGYQPDKRLRVQAVCTLCHADREKVRRG